MKFAPPVKQGKNNLLDGFNTDSLKESQTKVHDYKDFKFVFKDNHM